ncbi:hypothetical protein MHU86_19326 [Fragilaria crotonensis]|nr:hypothetical protein MHU86_19326 [Fragilaria crotonensis]
MQGRPVTASKDADVILPPVSPLNPVPALPAALRIDNREMLLSLLQSIPGRQLLVFGCESLRTLLMRQVLSDPHGRVFKGKKNWDAAQFFPLPHGLQIIGTKVLPDKISQFNSDPSPLPIADVWDEKVDVFAECHDTSTADRRLSSRVRPLSLEYPDALKECEIEGTPSSLIATVARALLKIQDVVGTIPRLQALGPLGEEVVKKMTTMRLEQHLAGQSSYEIPAENVRAMMVIDRKVDMLTPMLTPLTYEGLLDQVVGIDCGFLKVNVQVINPDDAEPEQVALGVNGSDALYMEVRDQHVEKFGSFLQNQAKALQQSHANFTNKEKKKDLDEIHQFVKQIPIFTKNLRSLTNHIHLAELVKANSEESSFRERWQTERSMVEGEVCYDILEELIATQHLLCKS